MFCPNCGKADQEENSFCRQCGTFLPDFDKVKKRKISPETHFKANIVLNIMSGVVSLTLAILLYIFFLGREATHPIIYITGGFLIAMFFWQVQVFWRNMQLKKQFPKRAQEIEKTKELLNEADLEDVVPASVTEFTTKNLKENVRRSS
jgi:uncharacterized membrane protein YvbJ